MSQAETLTPSLTPTLSSVTSTPGSQPAPWGRLLSKHAFLQSTDLYKDRYVLGRALNCDIVLRGGKTVRSSVPLVSKVHLAISRDDTDVPYIEDLSKNGTYLNGKLMSTKRKALRDGDIICVGYARNDIYEFRAEGQSYISGSFDTKYKLTKLLGQGAFGKVYLAHDKKFLHRYAIKKIDRDISQETPKVRNEIEILSRLEHDCIIHMVDVVYGPDHVYIVLEYMAGGDLQERVLQHRCLAEPVARLYMYQMAKAVQYLHRHNITHRDLKPENVLLASRRPRTLLKLADFGLSKILGESCVMRTLCGTPLYLAPEIVRMLVGGHAPYTQLVDVWSLGCVLYYMLYGRTPFQVGAGDVGHALQQLYKRVQQADYEIPGAKPTDAAASSADGAVSAPAVNLVVQMLVVEPEHRITVDQILGHQWLSEDHEMRHTFTMLSTNSHIMRPPCCLASEGQAPAAQHCEQ